MVKVIVVGMDDETSPAERLWKEAELILLNKPTEAAPYDPKILFKEIVEEAQVLKPMNRKERRHGIKTEKNPWEKRRRK